MNKGQTGSGEPSHLCSATWVLWASLSVTLGFFSFFLRKGAGPKGLNTTLYTLVKHLV